MFKKFSPTKPAAKKTAVKSKAKPKTEIKTLQKSISSKLKKIELKKTEIETQEEALA